MSVVTRAPRGLSEGSSDELRRVDIDRDTQGATLKRGHAAIAISGHVQAVTALGSAHAASHVARRTSAHGHQLGTNTDSFHAHGGFCSPRENVAPIMLARTTL